MAQQQAKPKKKKTRVPWTSLIFGGLAGVLAYRGLIRPSRSVVQDGYATACPGEGCRQTVQITSATGKSPIYSVVSGNVLEAGSEVVIAASTEPVLVSYSQMPDAQLMVRAGDRVAVGQLIGYASQVSFGVSQIKQTSTSGQFVSQALEPTSWLSSRGLSLSRRGRKGTQQWCESGRTMTIPESVLNCGVDLPKPSSFLLLPVQVQTEKA